MPEPGQVKQENRGSFPYAVQRAYETTPGARLATAGLTLYGDTLVCAATNGVLYVLQATV